MDGQRKIGCKLSFTWSPSFLDVKLRVMTSVLVGIFQLQLSSTIAANLVADYPFDIRGCIR